MNPSDLGEAVPSYYSTETEVRWQKTLTPEEVALAVRVTGPTLDAHGYERGGR